MNDFTWFEVWWAFGCSPTSLLILVGDEPAERFRVIDPDQNGKVLFEATSYEEASYWLAEDDYTKVDGRIDPDDV